MNDLIPISDEQAQAIQELAKLGNVSVEAIRELCHWGGKVMGTIPEDFLAFLIGDRLRFRRIKNLIRYREELGGQTAKEPTPISPSIAEPLFEAAADETDETLRGLWARLIANALNPGKSHLVRRSQIDLLKQFDPLDAVVLQHYARNSSDIADDRAQGTPNVMLISYIASAIGSNSNEVEVSLLRLTKLECLEQRTQSGDLSKRQWSLAAPGRLLLNAVS